MPEAGAGLIFERRSGVENARVHWNLIDEEKSGNPPQKQSESGRKCVYVAVFNRLKKPWLFGMLRIMGVAEIQEEAMKLDDWDRAELAGKILDSLGGADPGDDDADSLAEAIRRGEELKSGKVQPISKDELFDEFRKSRGK